MYLAISKLNMQKKYFKALSLLPAMMFCGRCLAQSVSISHTVTVADSTAILDISSTKKGLLIPRMPAQQKTAIITPATGLLIYQTDGSAGFYYFDGVSWLFLNNSVTADRQTSLLYTVRGF